MKVEVGNEMEWKELERNDGEKIRGRMRRATKTLEDFFPAE